MTHQKIGQIWVHHTGHNETHGYGTSTREWQLDTVILLERVERQDDALAFTLRFKKGRERTPDNWTEFEDATVTLADDEWSSVKGKSAGRQKTATDLALDVLNDEIARGHGSKPPSSIRDRMPAGTLCLTADHWRKVYELRSLAESPEAAKRAFYRAARTLIKTRKQVAKYKEWVWPV